MDSLNSYADMRDYAGQRQWTTTEKRILKRLVLKKYNIVTQDVSSASKDLAWIKLMQEFNRTVFGSFMMSRTVMELRLQWEKITENVYTHQSRHLLNSYYRAKARNAKAKRQAREDNRRARSQVLTQVKVEAGKSDEQLNHLAKKRSTSAMIKIGDGQTTSRPSTVGGGIDEVTMESDDEHKDSRLVDPRRAARIEKAIAKYRNPWKPDYNAQKARLELKLAEVDKKYWRNKFERIESQCKNN